MQIESQQITPRLAFLFQEPVLTQDQSEAISQLIKEWHDYEKLDRPQLGVPPCSVYAKDYRTSDNKRFGDDASEDSDMALMGIRADAVAACVHELTSIHQHAIQNWLRNRAARADVFRHPRLGTPEQAIQLYIEAKQKLLPMLKARDLVR